MLVNLAVSIIIVLVIAAAVVKLVINKKKGAICSGCPYGGTASQDCSCSEQSNCVVSLDSNSK